MIYFHCQKSNYKNILDPPLKLDLKEIITHVIKLNLELVKKKKIKIENNITDDAYKISGDRNRLIEIFTNLIDNACKYSDSDTVIKISLVKKMDTILFSIKDQGVGIPKKYLSRITERFFRVDPARSKDAGGTGLGLAIVKHIVNQHRATMDIIVLKEKVLNLPLNSQKYKILEDNKIFFVIKVS